MKLVEFLQSTMLALSLLVFFQGWMIWMFVGESYRFPAAYFIFWFVKFISDGSLTVRRPENSIVGPSIQILLGSMLKHLFFANVDIWFGNCGLIFLFGLNLENKGLRYFQTITSVLSMFYILFVEYIYQLTFSYSIYSAIWICFFSYLYSYDVDAFITKWTQPSSKKVVPHTNLFSAHPSRNSYEVSKEQIGMMSGSRENLNNLV